MARHSTAELWAAWVGEQQESERNVLEFCERIGGSPNSFYRWRQKLATKGKLPGRRETRGAKALGQERVEFFLWPRVRPVDGSDVLRR